MGAKNKFLLDHHTTIMTSKLKPNRPTILHRHFPLYASSSNLQFISKSIHRIPIAGEMKSPTPAPKPSPKLFLSPPPSSSIVNDCSQEFCTPYCLQWCSANSDYLQPPPSFDSDPDSDSSSSSSISPVLIVLICVLAAAFLLLFYCSFASKICKKRRRSGRRQNDVVDEEQQLQARFALVLQERLGPSIQIESSAANPNGGSGLDEGFIKSITVFKYKRGDGLVESTECAVCLTEFSEEEDLRLMPNCQHAFHPPCIDTWLRSQSSCPICRASMIGAPATAPAVAVSRMRFQGRRDAVVVVVVDGSNEVNFVRREIDPDRRQTTMTELDHVEAVVEKEREVVG